MANANLPVYPDNLPRVVSSNGLSVREDILFTDAKGRESDSSRKNAEKILEGWRNVLPALLEPDETIVYIVKRCQAPIGALEQLFLGWQAYSVTATTLVLTNLRILHFGVDIRGHWKRTIKSVRWGDIQEAQVKGLLSKTLQLKYANGKKEKYWRLPGKDGKKVKDVLAAIIPASRGEATPAGGIVSICPECRTLLTPGIYRCSQCGLTFKDEKTLLKRTILVPGGGYLYAGIWVAGVAAVLAEGIFTVVLLYSLLAAFGLFPGWQDEQGRVMSSGEMWGGVFFLSLLLGLDKALQYVHSRRVVQTFIPLKRSGQG